MKNTGTERPPEDALLSAKEIAKLIVSFGDHNYTLGLKKGYARGREDQREGRPWLPGTKNTL